ncbi:MAG: hypothetical protein R6W78_12630 [Bacteroidales bacterium]
MKQEEAFKLILPDEVLEYFTVVNAEKSQETYLIYLDEKNIPPSEKSEGQLVSKGFYDQITVQDFPLRGKACYLKVKRRRWMDIETGKIVSRDWDLVAKGTRMTVEFATFLKAINR